MATETIWWDPTHAIGRRFLSPLSEADFTPPERTLRTAQFCTPLSESELRRLAAYLREYPSLQLSVYGNGLHSPVPDLEFLRDFSFLTKLSVNIWTLPNLDGLRHLSPARLTHLSLWSTKKKRNSLSILEPFTALRQLSVDGHAKDFEALASLRELRSLSLRSITVPTLRPLVELNELRSLTISLGGTTALDELARIEKLAFLELTMIRGLADLRVLAEIATLEHLWLRSLKHVDRLPSFRSSAQLRVVWLDQLRALTDLRPIADAPELRELWAVDMTTLPPAAFTPFVNHPTLEALSVGLGSQRANAALRAMFPSVHWGVVKTKLPTFSE
jgi:hypothetical protein